MKKNIILLFAGLFLILTGCSEDVVTVEQPVKETNGKAITVKAGMPGENSKTRMAMTPNDLDIILTWEDGDEILLVFDDGTNVIQQTVTIETITNEGRTATFEIVVPQEILDGEAATFNLYGLYGGVSFSTTEGEESLVNLQANPWSGNFLYVQDNEIVLIRFAQMNIDKNSPSISVNFQHVGSLFKIYLDNTGTTNLENITGVELFSESPLFAHQNADPLVGAKFDLISGTFTSGTEFSNVIPFTYNGPLFAGDVLQLWGWYSPSQEEEDIWPEINLRVNYGAGLQYETNIAKPARTTTTEIGRVYHFFARFDSALDPALAFTDIVNGSFIDERDGQLYTTVRIGDQVWMAENLRYFPGFPDPVNLNLPADGSTTEPRYYVQGYNGEGTEDVAAANLILYGVLYNWPAAMNGAASSSANPSGVQGVCPDGWHLPSEAEWVQLTDFVRSPDLSDAANKLKEVGNEYWNNAHVGATNEYGFSARGGGSRQAGTPHFFNLRVLGHWFTSTEAAGGIQVRAAWMQDDAPQGGYNQGSKDFGGSLRCVKD